MDGIELICESSSEDEVIVELLQAYRAKNNNEAGQSSTPTRNRNYIQRDREESQQRLWDDYFSENPKYPPNLFKRHFRMHRQLFVRIVQVISDYSVGPIPDHFDYFKQRSDALSRLGFTTLQKCTSAIRQLSYGTAADIFDKYLQLGERTSIDCLNNFCKCVFDLYSAEYLRKPTATDIQRLYEAHEQKHGFKGMLGSIDCMHWKWKNC